LASINAHASHRSRAQLFFRIIILVLA